MSKSWALFLPLEWKHRQLISEPLEVTEDFLINDQLQKVTYFRKFALDYTLKLSVLVEEMNIPVC